MDAAVQLEKWRQSRRVQVVRQSTGEVVSEHEHARAAARVYGIPVGSVWHHIHNQKVKDGLRIRAAIQSNPPSPMCAGRVQGGNNDLARTTTSQHAISADSSPHGEDCARSNHNSPADSEHGLGCAAHAEDGGNVLEAWDQWSTTLSPCPLQSQAICMAFDERTRRMVVPTPECQTYQGYVQSVGESSCWCWFDDHSEMDVPHALVRQCLVRPDPAQVTMPDGPFTEQAALLVDICARVWGDGVMPPCIRDSRDGKTGTAVFLVFNCKTIYTGGRGGVGNPTDVVDHTSAAQVEFLELDRVTGLTGTAVCSHCHSFVQRRNVIMTARTGKTKVLDPCCHIVAVRHIARRQDRIPQDPESRTCDHLVDAHIARTARRFSCQATSPSEDPDDADNAFEGPHTPDVSATDDRHVQHEGDDLGAEDLDAHGAEGGNSHDDCVRRPSVSVLPTASTCHFMVLQVRAPLQSHLARAWT